MKRNIFLLSLVALAMLSGCSIEHQGPEGVRNVKWYVSHAAQMRKQLAWCGNQSDRSQLASCKNADAAMNENEARASLGGSVTIGKGGGQTPSQLFNNYHP